MLDIVNDVSFLEKLYTENYALVYKLVNRILRQYSASSSDASDIVQDVFVLAAKKIEVLRNHPNPVGWLIKTAQYVCMNHVNAYARHNEQLFETLDLHSNGEDTIAEVNTRISLEQMLKPEDYLLLKAYYIEKRPTDEICRDSGLSPNLLRVRMHRLKKYLSSIFILFVIFASTHHI